MKRRLDQPPVVPETVARRRDLVFVYALLGSIVICLICGLIMRHDRYSSGGTSIGWPLQVLMCLIVILVACVVYGLASKAMWQATFGAVLGTCVGFMCALGIVMTSSGDDLPKDKMSLALAFYNHTGDHIRWANVDATGYEGVHAHSRLEYGCCVTYPKVWAPNLTAKVGWISSSSVKDVAGEIAPGKLREEAVFIEQFREPGSHLRVHFLPEGKVQVLVSSLTPDQPGYPGPPKPEKPKESSPEERFSSDFAPPKLLQKAAP
jgi:hypothetical protein